ncbi:MULTISPECIES: pyridoxamine 5'-phosphate oxidase family protein [Neobacillus]|uniref:Pyridoxamine 5'-phosphate oxidase family protein n=1 Tax=Neobacillus citreus TaxID=2833578 RepID=A0A942SV64_9BACI|nr:pyridoxamine 5'-phosphate oxidase family protein [Neobacillus citreus]MCH6266250.1 pyridoxamine 5'-phosphate oxidase family protein [Neobacillus citreus]
MTNSDLKEKVQKVISDHKTGILSTVENNKPHSRYMTFYNDELTLYTPTKRDTEKIGEIEKNPNVSVLLGYEKKGQTDSYVEISGTTAVNDSTQLKQQYWEESFNQWFNGPDDPNYIFLEIKPETVRIMNLNGEPSQELNL